MFLNIRWNLEESPFGMSENILVTPTIFILEYKIISYSNEQRFI